MDLRRECVLISIGPRFSIFMDLRGKCVLIWLDQDSENKQSPVYTACVKDCNQSRNLDLELVGKIVSERVKDNWASFRLWYIIQISLTVKIRGLELLDEKTNLILVRYHRVSAVGTLFSQYGQQTPNNISQDPVVVSVSETRFHDGKRWPSFFPSWNQEPPPKKKNRQRRS